jgi:hypothetical protein
MGGPYPRVPPPTVAAPSIAPPWGTAAGHDRRDSAPGPGARHRPARHPRDEAHRRRSGAGGMGAGAHFDRAVLAKARRVVYSDHSDAMTPMTRHSIRASILIFSPQYREWRHCCHGVTAPGPIRRAGISKELAVSPAPRTKPRANCGRHARPPPRRSHNRAPQCSIPISYRRGQIMHSDYSRPTKADVMRNLNRGAAERLREFERQELWRVDASRQMPEHQKGIQTNGMIFDQTTNFRGGLGMARDSKIQVKLKQVRSRAAQKAQEVHNG